MEQRVHSFPVPVLGETVHSVVSRHLARQAGGRRKHLDSLGISAGTPPHAPVMTGIHALANFVPDGHPWHDNPLLIVEKHSAVPLFTAFSSESTRNQITKIIADGEAANPSKLLGFGSQSPRRTPNYKFCRECVVRDRQYGFPVSYRHHQPDFVRACAIHEAPLVYGCMEGHSSDGAVGRWSMAGHCNCDRSYFKFACQDDDHGEFENWLWFAKQTHGIFNMEGTPNQLAAEVLRSRLCAKFPSGTGLALTEIDQAADDVFGTMMLQDLKIKVALSNVYPRWPFHAFAKSRSEVVSGRGNFARLLVLTRLVAESVQDLFLPNQDTRHQPLKAAEPKGYASRKLEAASGDKDLLLEALQSCSYKLLKTSQQLGMSNPTYLSARLLANQIRVPLLQAKTEKLGAQRIQNVKAALLLGQPKKEVLAVYGLSTWDLTLIELDDPYLMSAHRQATVEKQRAAHRLAVEQFVAAHPEANRTEVSTNVSAVDWLREHDGEWLERTLPKKARPGGQTRTQRRDWPAIDAESVANLHTVVTMKQNLDEDFESKPYRMTSTSLLRILEIPFSSLIHLPNLKLELERLSEPLDEYRHRRIRWALKEYDKLDLPLSMNKFRIVAGLNANVIAKLSDFVEAEAISIGLLIDARMFGKNLLARE